MGCIPVPLACAERRKTYAESERRSHEHMNRCFGRTVVSVAGMNKANLSGEGRSQGAIGGADGGFYALEAVTQLKINTF